MFHETFCPSLCPSLNTGQFNSEADLSVKQDLLREGNDVTLNVGQGSVMLEDNSKDNTNGAGVTLRALSNPTNGSIFAVRSSGQSSTVGSHHSSSPIVSSCEFLKIIIMANYLSPY